MAKIPASLAALMAMLALSACSRDVVIEQGINPAITVEQILAVEGLNAKEVRSQLGPPQSRWQLDKQVWVYHFRHSTSESVREIDAEVIFSDEGKVSEVVITKALIPETDETPESGEDS